MDRRFQNDLDDFIMGINNLIVNPSNDRSYEMLEIIMALVAEKYPNPERLGDEPDTFTFAEPNGKIWYVTVDDE